MRKLLIPVNDTKGSKLSVSKLSDLLLRCHPEILVLLYVKKYDASFLMDEMASNGEISTLTEALQGTDYQEALDKKAQIVLDFYKNYLEDKGVDTIETLAKTGHPAEEIINTANEQNVDMIVMGTRGNRFNPLMMGSVSREVANRAEIPVLLIK